MPFVKTHLPCNDCGSSDGMSLNDDGWTHCFVCEARTAPLTDVNAINHREVQVEAKQLDVTQENYVTISSAELVVILPAHTSVLRMGRITTSTTPMIVVR